MSTWERERYPSFIENRNEIESNWSSLFGDRKNEIVFIGQDMDEDVIREELKACLATQKEINSNKWKYGYDDNWPV